MILWRASLRYLLRHPMQMGAALLGIALGVAVVVAVDLANQSASRGFSVSHQALTGRATHQILPGPSGLPDELYRRLRVEHGLRSSAPVVEGVVRAEDGRVLRVLGVDPLAEGSVRPTLGALRTPRLFGTWLGTPRGVMMLAGDAARLGLEPGDELPVLVNGDVIPLMLLAVLEPASAVDREGLRDVLVMDIAAAQELLGRIGRLDRIDLVLPSDEAAARLRPLLPADAQLLTSRSQAAALEQMTRAFRTNLTAFSLLALVVGGFLIYNSVSFSVLQRRSLIGMLRALGVRRRQVFALVLSEAALLGVLGTVLGVLLGVALSKVLLGMVTRTINDLYFVLSVHEVSLGALTLMKGVALGVGVTLLAALLPAREAASAAPRAAVARASLEAAARGAVWPVTVAGVILIAAGFGVLVLSRELLPGFGGLFAVILGSALLAPVFTVLLLRVFTPILGKLFGMLGRMAARGIGASLSRTGIAVAALMVAISAVVGVGVMVDSFRSTFSLWLESTLRADVYVSPVGDPPHGLEADVIARLARVDGVRGYTSGRYVRVGWGDRRVALRVFDIEPFARGKFQFKTGDPTTIWPAFQERGAVLVTEPFASHHGLAAGDRLRLATARGEQEFPIVGVMYDYSSSEGAVVMSRRTYDRYWNDPVIDSIGIRAESGAELNVLRERLIRAAGQLQPLELRLNRDVREASLKVFDQTFTITEVLRLLAMLVAGVGVLGALLAQALERAREFAVMRAIGITPVQLWTLIGLQTSLLGLIAGLLAIPLGLALAAALILVINQRSFGWSMLVSIDPLVLWQALLLAVVAALLAGVYPAWRLARSSPLGALREE